MSDRLILDETAMLRTLMRLSHQIVERNDSLSELCLVGIRRRGVPIARLLADNIRSISDITVNTGELDITLYRDDLTEYSQQASVNGTSLDFDVNGKTVILVDDVLYTGRTARAAIEALIKCGRPACIQYAVLIDRGHRELPLRGDFVGKNIPTSRTQRISVKVPEYDGRYAVELVN